MFDSPGMRDRRLAYCKKDWKYKSLDHFEAAIYQLDWEGKIDFVGPHEISFRLDRSDHLERAFTPSDRDKTKLLTVLTAGLADADVGVWQLIRVAKACMRMGPFETTELLRTKLHGDDEKLQRRAAEVIAELVPDDLVGVVSERVDPDLTPARP